MSSSDHRRNTNVLGFGTFGLDVLPKLESACDRMGATVCLNAVGVAELNRGTNHTQLRLSRPGVVDVSPTVQAIELAVGFSGDDIFAERHRHTWEPLAFAMADGLVQATLARKLIGSQTLVLMGMTSGHGRVAQQVLSRIYERIPDQFITLKTTLPDDSDKRPDAIRGYHLFHDLYHRRVVTLTILGDNASPFAQKPGFNLTVQDRFEAFAFASLLAAQPQFSKNKSLAEVSKSLGRASVFASWSFASRSLELVSDGFGRQLLGRFKSDRGLTYVHHLIHEAQLGIHTALSDPDTRTIDEDIDPEKPLFIVITVPMPLTERRAWETFSSELRRWLIGTYPSAVPIFASGNGAPDPRFIGKHWLQVSCLFPLPPVPRPMQPYLERPALPSPAYRLPVHANGSSETFSDDWDLGVTR